MGSHIFTSTAHVRYGEREENSFPVSEKQVKLKTLFRLAEVIYSCTSRHQWQLVDMNQGKMLWKALPEMPCSWLSRGSVSQPRIYPSSKEHFFCPQVQ